MGRASQSPSGVGKMTDQMPNARQRPYGNMPDGGVFAYQHDSGSSVFAIVGFVFGCGPGAEVEPDEQPDPGVDGQVWWAYPPSEVALIALIDAQRAPTDVEITGLSITYGGYQTVAYGEGALPSEAELRGDLVSSLTTMATRTRAADVELTTPIEGQVDAAATGVLGLNAVRMNGTADEVSRFVDIWGPGSALSSRPEEPPADSSTRRIRNSGAVTDWHPAGGTVHWWWDTEEPGVFLTFWFDQRALNHYSETHDAFEMQANFQSACFKKRTGWKNLLHQSLNFPNENGYADTPALDGAFDGEFNMAGGTTRADQLTAWEPYWIWLPVAKKNGCDIDDDDDANIWIYSQPSVVGKDANPESLSHLGVPGLHVCSAGRHGG